MSRDATSAFAEALVDEWVRGGVTHAVISPGSRSAPVAYAIADDDRVSVQVVLDERAAAFVALGLGRATGQPAVVLTTSGTAGANLHPAVLEAHHGCVPLLVCTADRPPELRDTGAPQTIDQRHLFGPAVRWFADVPVPVDSPDIGAAWRELGARSVAETRRGPPGPVHLNLAFRDPLVPTGAARVEAPGRTDGRPWIEGPSRVPRALDSTTVTALATRIEAEPHGLLIAGSGGGVEMTTACRFAALAGWPIVADPLSDLRAARGTIAHYEALVRAEAFASEHVPTFALRVGAPLTSATMTRRLEAVGTETVLIDPEGRWREPVYGASSVLGVDPELLLVELSQRLEDRVRGVDPAWSAAWRRADSMAGHAIDRVLDRWPECSEPRTARDVVAAMPTGGTLVVASSMPVRDVEWFARPRADIRIVSNRGVNGIDGFVSTALGVALGSAGPVVALAGDLSFLHDGGGRLAAQQLDTDVVFVVVDNNGGGIFSFLPQADHPAHFEDLFGTPPHADIAAIAAAHGFAVIRAGEPEAIGAGVEEGRAAGGPVAVIVTTDRSRNVDHHRAVWDSVSAALSAR